MLKIVQYALPQILVIRLIAIPVGDRLKFGRCADHCLINVWNIFEELFQPEMSKRPDEYYFTKPGIFFRKFFFGNALQLLNSGVAALDDLIRYIPRIIERPSVWI